MSTLKPLDRYLFLYFLTNEHTNIAGIYELPMRTISFESGMSEKKVIESLENLGGKVYYIEGWVYIKNFQKHQNMASDKVMIGVKSEMSKVPKDILAHIKDIDTISGHIIYLDSNLNPDLDLNLNSPKGDEPLNFVKALFKGFKENGIEIQDASGERQKYPSLFRRKNPDPNYWIGLAKFSQRYNFRPKEKQEYVFPWKGPVKLSKIYYEIRAKYEEERSGSSGKKKLEEMKAGVMKSF